MVDTRTRDKRHEIMSKVRSKHTQPELLIRKLIFGMGYRYRLHVRTLPGKPDIVLPRRKKIIDVRGCFWHGHKDCRYGNLPKSSLQFWSDKIARNRERDIVNGQLLSEAGWKVLIVWQCELKNREILEKRLYEFLESH